MSALFESDSDALTNIIQSNKVAKQATAEMNLIKTLADELKTSTTSVKIDEFIYKVKVVNEKLKNLQLDEELVVQIRENICYIARDVEITLHNEKRQTIYALRIANMLKTEFSDLPNIKPNLTQDVSTLIEQSMLKSRIKIRQEEQNLDKKAKNITFLIVVGILILLLIISGLIYRIHPLRNTVH